MPAYVADIDGALYLDSTVMFTQITMVAALMIQLKMVILCFTWHAYMGIYLACRFTFSLAFLDIFLRSMVVSNHVHLVSYCWNVEQT